MERVYAGIVVAFEQLAHQHIPLAALRELLPALDRQRGRAAEPDSRAAVRAQPGPQGSAHTAPVAVATRVAVAVSTRTHALSHIAFMSSSGTCSAPMRLLSDSTNTGGLGVEAAQPPPDAALEHLLRRLRLVREVAQHRSAMGREPLQIEDLSAEAVQRLQQAALARSGQPAHDAQAVAPRELRQLRHHGAAVSLVAALEPMRVPADLSQDVHHRLAALAAAPAVDQRPPRLRLVHEAGLDVLRDVARHQRRARLAAGKG